MKDESAVTKVVVKGVALYPRDWEVVAGVANENGLSISATLRMIVREWERITFNEWQNEELALE